MDVAGECVDSETQDSIDKTVSDRSPEPSISESPTQAPSPNLEPALPIIPTASPTETSDRNLTRLNQQLIQLPLAPGPAPRATEPAANTPALPSSDRIRVPRVRWTQDDFEPSNWTFETAIDELSGPGVVEAMAENQGRRYFWSSDGRLDMMMERIDPRDPSPRPAPLLRWPEQSDYANGNPIFDMFFGNDLDGVAEGVRRAARAVEGLAFPAHAA
ncbi:hypothetical protein B0T25DRAFT_577689 [Lasiosphaeria hispida]|uniref:Uncharacterized protein n=1 Tax=Lasiosphaeria hispida TaxID=260671 RepID=A0AAJ0HQX9_9PEZI|nr:hypothetical protein B0T25DRAFT_577689 [Lasiosphaeria hispida]